MIVGEGDGKITLDDYHEGCDVTTMGKQNEAGTRRAEIVQCKDHGILLQLSGTGMTEFLAMKIGAIFLDGFT